MTNSIFSKIVQSTVIFLIATLLLMVFVPASAQAPVIARPGLVANDATRGWLPAITVQGRSVQRFRADILRFAARGTVVAVSTPAAGIEVVDRIADALIRVDVDPSSVRRSVQVGNFQQGVQVSVGGSFRQPTRARVLAALSQLSDRLRGVSNFNLQQIGMQMGLQDCTGVDDRLRRAALDDGKRRAEAIARDAGVALGPLISASEINTTAAACGAVTNYYPGLPDGVDIGPGEPMLELSTQLNLSFAIATK